MKTIINNLEEMVQEAFEASGYDKEYGKVHVSNRPDLCQYQCNGAMAAAKVYKKAPIAIAQEVVEHLNNNEMLNKVEAINPGFINIEVAPQLLADLMNQMNNTQKFGLEQPENVKTIVIDYGGPNVAKALHVGHLRSAVIGESLKRIARYMGHKVLGDVHLGDWGLPIGLVITELKKRQPELPYFDESYTGEYPEEAPFTMADLEEIYPYASKYSKEHEDYLNAAAQVTSQLQAGHRGYHALWQHIINVSVTDLKKNYENLNVTFDLWKKESDVNEYIPIVVNYLKDNGYAHISEGALVVDVKEDSDKKEIPPCMILKSNGASLYSTTDVATIWEREKLFKPDEIIYVVDKRQNLHFEQVFRCCRKTKIIRDEVKLTSIGFGTMNGKGGTPFKTRDGGLLRLETLLGDVNEKVRERMSENREFTAEEQEEISRKISLAAIKYGDLSNQASKDYIFDIDRFTSFEGNTGPYILYTIVRIKSILSKYKEQGGTLGEQATILAPAKESETNVMLTLTKFTDIVTQSYEENAPHKICQFVYELSENLNRFYHETKILSCEDEKVKQSYLQLILLVEHVLETAIDLLGLSAPDKM